MKQDDKIIKNIILEIVQKYNVKFTDAIIQKSSFRKQSDLNAFDIHKNDCMIYSTSLQNQLQEIIVTKMQADICCHLKIMREIADE